MRSRPGSGSAADEPVPRQLQPQGRARTKQTTRAVTDRIIEIATILENEPVPWKTHDVARIKGREDTYRIRLGDLRIIYKINKRVNEVTIQRIASRGGAYKGTD